MKLDVVVKELEKKHGVRAKVKPGNVYENMDRAKPSNTMGIILVWENDYEELITSLVGHSNMDWPNLTHILFTYAGNGYLTVNTYKPADVKEMMTATSSQGIDREETVSRAKKRIMPQPKTIAESISSPATPIDPDDVPW